MYLIDSNVLISAYRDTYPQDVFLSFWTKLAELAAENKIASLDVVNDEIKRGNDSLHEWCNNHLAKSFFLPKEQYIGQYTQVVGYKNQAKRPASFDSFYDADAADAWLVAAALASKPGVKGIITNEVSAPDSKFIKLPDVCKAFDIECMKLVEAFRRLSVEI